MEEEIQNEGLIERAQKAHKIIKNPRKYKICSGCESIVAQKVTICPNCHAYSFISDESMVVAQAHELGKREAKSVLSADLD